MIPCIPHPPASWCLFRVYGDVRVIRAVCRNPRRKRVIVVRRAQIAFWAGENRAFVERRCTRRSRNRVSVECYCNAIVLFVVPAQLAACNKRDCKSHYQHKNEARF